jgi:hypothetical protein
MTPSRVTFALVLVMTVVLLAAGCVSSPEGNRSAGNATVNPIPVSPEPSPVTSVFPSSPCEYTDNATYWIKINPIETLRKGDKTRIRGTTNIPSGRTLDLGIYDSSMHPHSRCGFDDTLVSAITVREGEECVNTFSFYFDSMNFRSQEFLLTATYPENASVTNNLIFNLLKNSTPLVFPDYRLPVNDSVNVSFGLLPISDVRRGDIQTVQGIRKGIPYAIIYSIHEAGTGSECSPLSPWCPGGKIFGTIYPVMSGPDSSRFTIRFDTTDFKPGQYVVDMDFTCSDASAKGWFNVTPDIPVTS